MPQTDYDLIIIGAGPAGSTTARFASTAGLRVLLVDKRQELGSPIQCSGAISGHGLEAAGIDANPEFIHEAIYGFAIYDEAGARTVHDYRQLKPDDYGSGPGKKPLGYVVDRRRFDRYLMTQAERAGTEVWLKTEGVGYQPQADGSCTVALRRYNQDITLSTRVLVGADGLQSQVGKWAGLQTHIKITELAGCLQFIVDGVETEGLLEIVTGHEWAPGGYAWVFPKGHGYAEIGLGVIATMTDKPAQWHLDKFMQQSFFRKRFANARILEVQGGGVPLAAPLRTQYADNMILVGDAARHVNPITGGGLHTAVAGGKIAADFLIGHLQDGLPLQEGALQAYQNVWLSELGDKMWKLYGIKTDIFHNMNIAQRDEQLYATMSDYFSPTSEFKKI
ncbi:Kynurenine 3-monooxygenase [Neolewinella maritima]|uniref:Kynurenine 3-monooxygenase n=1 Tax=Neolewinella maritima TaxID=1383882 RepID=A0ABM9B0H5_9BACT|nr:NAD(P)/FAD-dependent oxidoreductase [Neolewinella maritima]CAH1000482.1 Kynurenine 3-monooxygenase [Neolewinella maritima]